MNEYSISYILNQKDLLIQVKVMPKSSKPGIDGIRNGALLVRVASPPEKGKANQELERIMAEELGLATFDVSVVSGFSSRSKRIRLPPGAEARLCEILVHAGALNIIVSAR